MCGIIAYFGDRSAGPILHEGLSNLEYRGYDSVGIALGNGQLTLHKQAGEVAELEVPDRPDATFGIGHTRWSTHGPPTDENAHPHLDCEGRVAVVHNGIVDNHAALREELSAHTFRSDTDTEVIPHLLEEALAEGIPLPMAVSEVVERIDGSYAFCAMDIETGCIVGTRWQSPLVVGHAEMGSFLASDVPAFLRHTRDVTFLEDGDVVVLERDGTHLFRDGETRLLEIESITWDPESAEKGGYSHYMRKEIHEQPNALRRAIADRFDHTRGEVILDIDIDPSTINTIQFVAAGTSFYAASYAAAFIEEHLDLRAHATIASEYQMRASHDPERTLVIAVTQSGETKDTLDAMRAADAAGAQTLAVTNIRGSSVTRIADDRILLRAGPEIAVASTKAFSSQVVVLMALTVLIGRERDSLPASRARSILASLADLPGAVQQVLDVEPAIKAAASSYLEADSYFFIGRHVGHPVAMEGALKLKEISYRHAEGFPAGELKHGPLALVGPKTPVLAVLTEGSRPAATLHNIREVQARDAPVIGAVSVNLGVDQLDERFNVPAIGCAEPLVANVYFQLFAYHTADQLGRSIDKPRHLAKSVTVD